MIVDRLIVYSFSYMRSVFRHGSLWAWLILLVAGLGPIHGFVDEIMETCPVVDHEFDAGQGQGVSESDPCHEHCAIGWSIAPSRSNSAAIVLYSDRPSAPPILSFVGEVPGASIVDAALRVSRSASPSAYHQRVGLRLYA